MSTRKTGCPGSHDRGSRADATANVQDNSAEARIGRKIRVQPNGCWLYNPRGTSHGYGQVNIGGGREQAHRWVYETLVGQIPEGHVLHHECDNKRCVNPSHLIPMTPSDHMAHHIALNNPRRPSRGVPLS